MNKFSKRKLAFTKMQALGNDFIVIDGTKQKITLSSDSIQKFADRHFGVGCDQILLIEPPKNPNVDFYYRIFNADGSEVAQCGNGARCIALFAKQKGLTTKDIIIFQTHERIIECHLLKNNHVKVNMGKPNQNPQKIPFLAQKQQTTYTIVADGRKLRICPLSVGNPHCVVWLKELASLNIEKIGGLLSQHPRFPQKTNVDFVQIMDKNTIRLRVFERGVGETLACGSAACAAMVASKLLNLVDKEATINMKGGTLTVEWDKKSSPVWLTGPAKFVFEGKISAF